MQESRLRRAPRFRVLCPGAGGCRCPRCSPESAPSLWGITRGFAGGPTDGAWGMRREPVPEPSPRLCSLACLSGASACAQGEAARGRPGMRGAAPARPPAGVGPRRRCRHPAADAVPAEVMGRAAGSGAAVGAGDLQLPVTGGSMPGAFRWHPISLTPRCPGTPGRHRRGRAGSARSSASLLCSSTLRLGPASAFCFLPCHRGPWPCRRHGSRQQAAL